MPPRLTPQLPSTWVETLSPEARGLLEFMLSHDVLAKTLAGPSVLDIRIKGSSDDATPLLPHAVPVAINPATPRETASAVGAIRNHQQCIVLRNVLQWLPDYRGFVRSCFLKLATGGHLIIVVPHQFLYERKLQLPSRVTPGHLRFYTPATLLAEIEEALDPCAYRVRLIADNDLGYDYAADIDRPPAGCRDIVVCLERMTRPAWSDQLGADEIQATTLSKPGRVLPLDMSAPPIYRVIAPDRQPIARIIVLKLDRRGDFLMAQRAFHILRSAFPKASITLVCGSWNRAEAETLGLFDTVLPFDFFAEDASAGARVLSFDELSLQLEGLLDDARYDLAIELRLYDDTRALLRSIRARHKAGFDSYDTFPWLTVRLPLPVPTRDGRAERSLVPAAEFETRAGRHSWVEIDFSSRRFKARQHLVWGPYIALKPGHYDIELLIEPAHGTLEVLYDMVAGASLQMIGRGVVRTARNQHPHISLYAPEKLDQLQCRLLAPKAGRLPTFNFKGMICTRQGSYIGVHQSESMALLAHLAALRLEDAFQVTEA